MENVWNKRVAIILSCFGDQNLPWEAGWVLHKYPAYTSVQGSLDQAMGYYNSVPMKTGIYTLWENHMIGGCALNHKSRKGPCAKVWDVCVWWLCTVHDIRHPLHSNDLRCSLSWTFRIWWLNNLYTSHLCQQCNPNSESIFIPSSQNLHCLPNSIWAGKAIILRIKQCWS